MVTLSKKTKIAIATTIALTLTLLLAIPFVNAQTPLTGSTTSTKTLQAKGYAFQKIDSSTIKYYPATLSLTVQAASTSGTARKFDVTGGTLVINRVSYSISSGVGGVLPGRHLILLKAQGTDPNGQAVTLGLEGQYFWMGGHQYVARIAARLQTNNGNVTLLMRAAI
jgi:hypothetical protein